MSTAAFGAALVTVPSASAAPRSIPAAALGAATPTPSPPTASPQPPTAPGNLTAVAHTTSITLSWTASQPGCCAIESYSVSYKRAFNDIPEGNRTVTDTTVTITAGIQPATEYRFSVSARDTAGKWSPSAALTVVTPATDTGPDTVPPAAPTNLTGTTTDSTVTLNWSAATDNTGVTGYRVYHFDGVFNSTLLATVTDTTYTGPLRYGRNHFYVRAIDAAGNVSIASNTYIGPQNTTPPTPTPTPTASPQPPTAPGNLTAVAHATSITLSWTASQPGCCAIESYYVGHKRAFNDIPEGSRTVTDTTVTISGTIRPATEYQFWVTARDTAGNVSPTATLTVVTPATDTGPDTVPPAAPTNLTGTATDSTVTLNWSAATDNTGVTGYRVYHFDGVFNSTLVATVTDTTYTGPLRYGRNEFYVRAVDAAGNVSIATDTFTGPRGTVPPTPTTPPTTLPPTTPPAPTCEVSYTTQSQWTGGFIAAITIENTSSTAINGWTLAFRFSSDQQISTSWNATYSQTGAEVTARSLSWNSAITPGGRVSTGFLGTWTASNSPPIRFTVNGSPCEVATA